MASNHPNRNTEPAMKTILITGAAGQVGTFLRREYKGKYHLRLSDMASVDDLADGETFIGAELTDAAAVMAAVDGVDGIVHLGGYSVEGPWQHILDANIIGLYNLYEAARAKGVPRVVFATSNHAVGFYRRDQTIDHTCYPKPDSRYGVSKVFGEAVASLYADKYDVATLCIRIGNVGVRPVDVRRLSIWISPRDIAQLVAIGLDHPDIKFEIVYGMSGNDRTWWDNANALRLGYVPADNSETYADEVFKEHSEDTGDPKADRHQGGVFVSTEFGGDPTKE